MRKRLLNLLLILSIPWILYSQGNIILNETFNDASTLPSGWEVSGDISAGYN